MAKNLVTDKPTKEEWDHLIRLAESACEEKISLDEFCTEVGEILDAISTEVFCTPSISYIENKHRKGEGVIVIV